MGMFFSAAAGVAADSHNKIVDSQSGGERSFVEAGAGIASFLVLGFIGYHVPILGIIFALLIGLPILGLTITAIVIAIRGEGR